MKRKLDPKLLIGFSDLIKQFYLYKSEELSKLNIKSAHCKMLHLLSDYNGINQQEIANIAGIKRSTTSELISEMVKEGLIERRSSDTDKRCSFLFLTALGNEKAQSIRSYFDDYCDTCVRNFSTEEINQFEHLLRKFKFTS